MKKVFSLVLALALCLTAVAFAEDVAVVTPSKTLDDLTVIEVEIEGGTGSETIALVPPVEEMTEEVREKYEEQVAVCNAEIEKLQEIVKQEEVKVEEYFGEVKSSTGETVDLREVLGVKEDEKLEVLEFCPVMATGFAPIEEKTGDETEVTEVEKPIKATMLFSTPYQEGEKVAVMIGIVTTLEDGTQNIDWQVFEGVGVAAKNGQAETSGAIQVELSKEIVLAIQNGTALMAVVSIGK